MQHILASSNEGNPLFIGLELAINLWQTIETKLRSKMILRFSNQIGNRAVKY